MVCWPRCLDGCQLRNYTAWVWILAFPSHQMGAILTGWFWECKHLGGAKPCPTGSCSLPCSDGVGKIYYTILVWVSILFWEKASKSETDSAASQLFRMSHLVCASASWAFHTCGGWSALRHGQTLRTVGQALSFRAGGSGLSGFVPLAGLNSSVLLVQGLVAALESHGL